jgi:hypothetical protein
MTFAFIKSPAKALVPVCAALAMLSPGAQAESTYGYNSAGTAGAKATAKVNLEIKVPMLILLRVGSSGSTVDKVTITASPSAGIPGGIAAAALANGSSLATGWNGTAPVMTGTSSPASVTAYAWTNSKNGGSVTGAMSTVFTSGGLTGASIAVASSAPVNGGLAHPGSNLGTFAPQSFTANSLRSSTWTYSLTTAALASVTAGTHSATVTYTATSL